MEKLASMPKETSSNTYVAAKQENTGEKKPGSNTWTPIW